ncbi:hypothetical protein LT330_001143 [Penicillium expansum]|nr:hypothetical protein LT330_001143 [Penicillium expansum]
MNSHVTGFVTDEDDNNQRVGGLVSIPDTNGVRYHAQQPVMQDLHQPLDPLVAALPPGPGSLNFSPAGFCTFHTNLLPACLSSDVLSFLSELVPLKSLPLSPPVSIILLRIMVSALRPDSYDIFWF